VCRLSETKMLTICVIKQIIVTHLLDYNCIATHFFLLIVISNFVKHI
jgi:hypothetical protein